MPIKVHICKVVTALVLGQARDPLSLKARIFKLRPVRPEPEIQNPISPSLKLKPARVKALSLTKKLEQCWDCNIL